MLKREVGCYDMKKESDLKQLCILLVNFCLHIKSYRSGQNILFDDNVRFMYRVWYQPHIVFMYVSFQVRSTQTINDPLRFARNLVGR